MRHAQFVEVKGKVVLVGCLLVILDYMCAIALAPTRGARRSPPRFQVHTEHEEFLPLLHCLLLAGDGLFVEA